jgi:hypothetical protein
MSEKRMIIVPYVFDKAKWSDLIAWLNEDFTYDEMVELTGVTVSCLKQWQRLQYKGEFQYPSMTNVLRVCNLLDFNPSKLFKVEDA